MPKNLKKAYKTLNDLERTLAESCLREEKELEKFIERLESGLKTLTHDLHSREGLRGTIHPAGVIELACGIHRLAAEVKIKTELINFLKFLK